MELESVSTGSTDPLSTGPLHIGMRRQDLNEVYGSKLRRLKGLANEAIYSVDRVWNGPGSRPERLVLTLRRGKLTAWYRVKDARALDDGP